MCEYIKDNPEAIIGLIIILIMVYLDSTNIGLDSSNIHNINFTLWVTSISPFIAVYGTYYFMKKENKRMEKNQGEIAKRGWNKQNGLMIKEEVKKFYYNNYILIRIKSIDEYVRRDIIEKVDNIYENGLINIDDFCEDMTVSRKICNFCRDITDLKKFNEKFLKKLKFDFDYDHDMCKSIDDFEKILNILESRKKLELICLDFLSMDELQDIKKDTRENALEKFWNYHNNLCDDKYRSNLAKAMGCNLSIVGDGKYFNKFKKYYSEIQTEENANENKKYSNPRFIKESNYI